MILWLLGSVAMVGALALGVAVFNMARARGRSLAAIRLRGFYATHVMRYTDEELLHRVINWDGKEMLCLCCGADMRVLGMQTEVSDGERTWLIDECRLGCAGCDQFEFFRADGYHGSMIGARLYPYDSCMRPKMWEQFKRWYLIECVASDNKRVVLGLMERWVRDKNVETYWEEAARTRPKAWWRRALHHTRRYFGQLPEVS